MRFVMQLRVCQIGFHDPFPDFAYHRKFHFVGTSPPVSQVAELLAQSFQFYSLVRLEALDPTFRTLIAHHFGSRRR